MDNNNSKLINGVLIILISSIIINWLVTFSAMKVALTRHEEMITNLKKNDERIERDIDKCWDWILKYNIEKTEQK